VVGSGVVGGSVSGVWSGVGSVAVRAWWLLGWFVVGGSGSVWWRGGRAGGVSVRRVRVSVAGWGVSGVFAGRVVAVRAGLGAGGRFVSGGGGVAAVGSGPVGPDSGRAVRRLVSRGAVTDWWRLNPTLVVCGRPGACMRKEEQAPGRLAAQARGLQGRSSPWAFAGLSDRSRRRGRRRRVRPAGRNTSRMGFFPAISPPPHRAGPPPVRPSLWASGPRGRAGPLALLDAAGGVPARCSEHLAGNRRRGTGRASRPGPASRLSGPVAGRPGGGGWWRGGSGRGRVSGSGGRSGVVVGSGVVGGSVSGVWSGVGSVAVRAWWLLGWFVVGGSGSVWWRGGRAGGVSVRRVRVSVAGWGVSGVFAGRVVAVRAGLGAGGRFVSGGGGVAAVVSGPVGSDSGRARRVRARGRNRKEGGPGRN